MLLVDGYDSIAKAYLDEADRYRSHDNDLLSLMGIFAIFKCNTGSRVIDRMIIDGELMISLDGITSGFNIANCISNLDQ